MPGRKVVVVGGGVAGVSAALAAAGRGAATTLIESKTIGLSKALMPSLVSERRAEKDIVLSMVGRLAEAGVETLAGETVTSVQHQEKRVRFESSGREGRLAFDSLVLCTGAACEPPRLRGVSKPNVFVLREPSDYIGLSAGLDAVGSVAVSGPLPLALKLGEVLAGRVERVRVYCGVGGLERQFSRPVADAIRGAAGGVSLVDGSVDAILGVDRAEAVVSGGDVHTCDAVVVVPRSVPSFPQVECQRGPGGGLLVDASMMTSLPAVFAAGDSAEMRFRSGSVPARLYSTGRMGGEVAGVNAAGGSECAAPSWTVEQTYFGLEFCSAGLGEADARALGIDAAAEVAESRHPDGRRKVVVSIVYDAATRQVCGLQAVGWGASSLASAASIVVSLGLTIDQLARMEFPYSPGSGYETPPIALTAGKIAKARALDGQAQSPRLRQLGRGHPRSDRLL